MEQEYLESPRQSFVTYSQKSICRRNVLRFKQGLKTVFFVSYSPCVYENFFGWWKNIAFFELGCIATLLEINNIFDACAKM